MTALAVLMTACSPERAVSHSGGGAVAGGCEDERLPALAGEWLVGCDAGAVDHATNVRTGERVAFGPVAGPVGLADGAVLGLGFDGGVWRLPGGEPDRTPYLAGDVVTAPAFDGAHVLLAYADHVEIFTVGDGVRAHIPALPVPGEPVALAWPTGVWVERRDGLDLVTADAAGATRVYAGGPGDQHLPAYGDGRFAWVDQGDLVVRPADGAGETRVEADAGFLSPPAVGGGRVCWEDRGAWRARGGRLDDAEGVDVRCLDGGLGGPGDQLHPSLSTAGLLVRVDGEPRFTPAEGG